MLTGASSSYRVSQAQKQRPEPGVFGQRSGADGAPQGAEFQVNPPHLTHSAEFPAVAADELGNFVVVWGKRGLTVSAASLAGQRFSSNGETLGSEFPISRSGFNRRCRHGGAQADSSWSGPPANGIGPEREVSGRRFNPAADPVGDEFQINVYTNNSQRAPAVATGGTGDSVVAWMSNWQDGSGEGIFGRQITPSIFRHAFESTPPFWSATTASTCSGYCATNSTPDGVCYCDELCLTLFDCCLDACLTCGQCVP